MAESFALAGGFRYRAADRLGRMFRRATCRHEWEDGYAFANCVEVAIPTGERRPVSWQVMQFCDHCGATERRQLSRAEYNAWIAIMEGQFFDGWGHVPIEDLPKVITGESNGNQST